MIRLTSIAKITGILMGLALPFALLGQNPTPATAPNQSALRDTIAFYQHLRSANLFREQLLINQQLRKTNKQMPMVVDSLRLDAALVYYLQNDTNHLGTTLREFPSKPNLSGNNYRQFLALNFLMNQRKADPWIKAAQDSITRTFPDVKHYATTTAVCLSALLPGAGKYYMGYKYQAMGSFLMNGLLLSQALESLLKARPNSTRVGLTTSLFGVFYIGNITGTYHLAKKRKRDHQLQLKHEIENYFISALPAVHP